MYTYGIAESDRVILIRGIQLVRGLVVESMASAVEDARIDTLRSLMSEYDVCDMLSRVVGQAISFNMPG